MGCEACKTVNPKMYYSCKIAKSEPYRTYIAPCGMNFERGSNYTPPKKKKKKRKK